MEDKKFETAEVEIVENEGVFVKVANCIKRNKTKVIFGVGAAAGTAIIVLLGSAIAKMEDPSDDEPDDQDELDVETDDEEEEEVD